MKIKELGIERTPFVSKYIDYDNQKFEIKCYAGIGSRSTPLHIGELMIKFAYYYALEGYVLRSGGAEGADTFFEIGADLAKTIDPLKGDKQIFLPRKNFFNNPSEFYPENKNIWESEEFAEEINKELGFLGGRFHKGLATMDEDSRRLMLRNGQQVMGKNLNDPSLAVICWTADGAISHEDRNLTTGGTGQAISIASCEYLTTGSLDNYFVKDESQQVINLGRVEHLEKVKKIISNMEIKHGSMPNWRKVLKWKNTMSPQFKNNF